MRRDLVLAGAVATVMFGAIAVLARVFSDGAWLGQSLGAIVVALALAAGVRRLGLHAAWAAAVSLLGFVIFTYITLLPSEGLFPGSASWAAFRDLVRTGLTGFREAEAPTPTTPGLLLLISGAAWWITHLSHELLIRARRPGLSLLPPAVLWAVPLAVPLPPGRTWPQALPFLAGAGLVLLLESDTDVLGWQRDRTPNRLSTSGVTVGIVALALAGLAPAVLPGYDQEPWYDVGAANDPRGYQPIVDVGDRLHLPEPRDVLEVRADRRMYYRLAALDSFDGSTWRLGPSGLSSFRPSDENLYRADADLPPETPIRQAVEARAQIRVLDLENIYVPVPYQPLRVTGPARDQMVYSSEGGFVATAELSDNEIAGRLVTGVVEGLEYGVISALPQPAPEEVVGLAADTSDPSIQPFLGLPEEYARLAELADSIYAERGAASPVEKAFALQNYFTEDASLFTYSTDVEPLRGTGALEQFVFENRTGYCEYYATAMAVMLRATGIPSRVAVGFLSGTEVTPPLFSEPEPELDPRSGRPIKTYRISTEDAHAWVEILVPGYGWIKFDPTPRSDGRVQPPTQDNLDPLLTIAERTSLGGSEADLPDPTNPLEDFAGPEPLGPDGRPLEGGGAGGGADRTGVHPALLLLVALVGFAGAGLVAREVYGRRPRPDLAPADRVLAAQRRVHAAAERYGVGRAPHETATDVARRWSHEGRADPAAAERFARLAQAAAFGGRVEQADGPEAETLGAALVGGLRASVTAGARVASPVRVPASRVAGIGRAAVNRARRRHRSTR